MLKYLNTHCQTGKGENERNEHTKKIPIIN